jgi:hypothetical protein
MMAYGMRPVRDSMALFNTKQRTSTVIFEVRCLVLAIASICKGSFRCAAQTLLDSSDDARLQGRHHTTRYPQHICDALQEV